MKPTRGENAGGLVGAAGSRDFPDDRLRGGARVSGSSHGSSDDEIICAGGDRFAGRRYALLIADFGADRTNARRHQQEVSRASRGREP